MTHLSDTSYLDRLVANLVFGPLIVYYVLVIKHGAADVRAWRSSGAGNGKMLRFVAFLLYAVAYATIIAYDVLATKLKYEEGFVDTCLVRRENGTETPHRYPKHAFLPEHACSGNHTFEYNGPAYINATWTNQGNCGIKQTPSSMYSSVNLDMLGTIDTLFNLSCTLRNSGLFLLLAWFNTSVFGLFHKPVLQHWEVRICAAYSLISLVWYFVLPTLFTDPLTSTISTQFLWSVELYVAAFFLFMTNWRVKRLQKRRGNNASIKTESLKEELVRRALEYALVANTVLAVICVGESTGLLILNVDIVLVDTGRVIYGSKLLTDIWTRVFNFFFVLEPLVSIFILYKPKAILLPETNTRGDQVQESTCSFKTGGQGTNSARSTSYAAGDDRAVSMI